MPDYPWCQVGWSQQPLFSVSLEHLMTALENERTFHIAVRLMEHDERLKRSFYRKLADTGISNFSKAFQENLLGILASQSAQLSEYRIDNVLLPYLSRFDGSKMLALLAKQALFEWIQVTNCALSGNEIDNILGLLKKVQGSSSLDNQGLARASGYKRNRSEAGLSTSIASCDDSFRTKRARSPMASEVEPANFCDKNNPATSNNPSADLEYDTAPSPPFSAFALNTDLTYQQTEFDPLMSTAGIFNISDIISGLSWVDLPTADTTDLFCHNASLSTTADSIIVPDTYTAGNGFQSALNTDAMTIVGIETPSSENVDSLSSPSLQLAALASTSISTSVSASALTSASESISASATAVELTAVENQTASALTAAMESSYEEFKQLLASCRTHRQQVLKASSGSAPASASVASSSSSGGSGSGSGSVNPKYLKQLTESGCALLERIGVISYSIYRFSEEDSGSGRSQASCSAIEEVPTLILQAQAMLALALFRAPDDLLSAISDLLFQRDSDKGTHDSSAKLAESGSDVGNRLKNVAPVCFLSGALLPRVRSLRSPASRHLLRAVEVAVKCRPDLSISCLVARSVQPCPATPALTSLYRCGYSNGDADDDATTSKSHELAAIILPSQFNFELLQRLSKQIITQNQLEALLLHMCALDGNVKYLEQLLSDNSSATSTSGSTSTSASSGSSFIRDSNVDDRRRQFGRAQNQDEGSELSTLLDALLSPLAAPGVAADPTTIATAAVSIQSLNRGNEDKDARKETKNTVGISNSGDGGGLNTARVQPRPPPNKPGVARILKKPKHTNSSSVIEWTAAQQDAWLTHWLVLLRSSLVDAAHDLSGDVLGSSAGSRRRSNGSWPDGINLTLESGTTLADGLNNLSSSLFHFRLRGGGVEWSGDTLKTLNSILAPAPSLTRLALKVLLVQLEHLSTAAAARSDHTLVEKDFFNSSAGLASLMHTIVTRFGKTVSEGLKKETKSILNRCTSVVSKSAMAVLDKLPE